MKSLEQRIAELEQALSQLLRSSQQGESRAAAPLQSRNGWLLGRLRQSLSPGGTVDVDVWIRTGGKWKFSGYTKTGCLDWFMNPDDDAAEAGTKCRIDHYHTCWAVTALYCDKAKGPDFVLSPGATSPGEFEASGGSSTITTSGPSGPPLEQ